MFKQRNYWRVSSERPEDIYSEPIEYYTEEQIEKYAKSKSMKKIQEELAYRIIELLRVSSGKLLDLGCGVGFTSEAYIKEGFDVMAIDLLPKMVEKAKERGIKAQVGDMRNLQEIFKKEEFDCIVSASALQWVKFKDEIEKVAFGINYILKPSGRVVIQFYPKSKKEVLAIAKIFKKNGFEGEIIIDNPDNPLKRRVFLVFNKHQNNKNFINNEG